MIRYLKNLEMRFPSIFNIKYVETVVVVIVVVVVVVVVVVIVTL